MKIIFLDFDGVLNSITFFIKRYRNMKDLRMIDVGSLNEDDKNVRFMLSQIDLDNFDILKTIIDKTDSKVVVISSWKYIPWFEKTSKHLIDLGIPIIDTTKEDNSINRGAGIKNYLKTHDVSNYIIIDDEIFPDYDEELMKHLIKTDFYENGLNEDHICKTENILCDEKMQLRRTYE